MLRSPGRDAGGAVPLSGARLRMIAQAVAASPAAWQYLVRIDPARRWHTRLRGTAEYDIWLESWLPGQGSGWHDHGGSAAVVVVARGELEERVPVLGGVVTKIRHVPEGGTRILRRRQVHELVNVSLASAVSVHVYVPPLAATRGYELGARGLRRAGAGRGQQAAAARSFRLEAAAPRRYRRGGRPLTAG